MHFLASYCWTEGLQLTSQLLIVISGYFTLVTPQMALLFNFCSGCSCPRCNSHPYPMGSYVISPFGIEFPLLPTFESHVRTLPASFFFPFFFGVPLYVRKNQG